MDRLLLTIGDLFCLFSKSVLYRLAIPRFLLSIWCIQNQLQSVIPQSLNGGGEAPLLQNDDCAAVQAPTADWF
jgi:hypothetical protein